MSTSPQYTTPAAPVVTVEARGPYDFSIGARGGTLAACHTAILDAIRALAAPTVCPDCGEPMASPGEIIGRDHYLCAACAAVFRQEQEAFAALLDAESEAA